MATKKAGTKKKQLPATVEQHRLELSGGAPSTKELINIEKKVLLIKALAEHGTIGRACDEAGVSRTTYYLWTNPAIAEHYGLDPKHYDAEFQGLCVEALTTGFRDKVLRTGYSRAIDGWVDKKYDRNGVLMSEEQKYDSSILQMLMKRVEPELRDKAPGTLIDNRQQHVTVNGAAKSAEILDALSPAQQRLLVKMVELGAEGQAAEDGDVIEGECVEAE